MNNDITQQLQQRIIAAISNHESLQIQGSGSKQFLGNHFPAHVLDTKEHKGIISYDPVELVVRARAGTTLRELEATLAESGQMLPFEPPHFGSDATIGGTIACGLAGPSRPYQGSARDYVLGVTIINGRGEVLHFGGQVMKNVAGYDCSRLMAGAMGTLGIILDVSMKVLPKPAAELTLIQICDEEEAIKRMAQWSAKPLQLSAACYTGNKLYFRLSGAKTAVDSACETIGGDQFDGTQFWESIKEQQHDFFQTEKPLWRLSIPAETMPLKIKGRYLLDWAGAQRWLISEESPERIRLAAQKAGGHATLFRRGSLDAEIFQRPEPGVMSLHRQLKHAFDPIGIFNPGRLYPGL